jgi:hypothetical protein
MGSNYPFAARYPIAYNIPPLESLPEWSNLGGSITRVVSTPHVGSLTAHESDLVHRYVEKAARAYIRAARLPKITELREKVWSLSNIGDPTGDRTVPIVFSYLPLAGEGFVSHLQAEVLVRFSDWRILHCESGDAMDLNLAIYPDAISVGREIFGGDPKVALATWRSRVLRFRETRNGPLRRQLNAVQTAVLARPYGFWLARSPAIVMAFDNYEGNAGQQTIWILSRGESPYDVEIDADYAEGNYYPIRRSGHIGAESGRASPSSLWLRQLVVPSKDSHGFRIRAPSKELRLIVNEFMRDIDLIQMEAEKGQDF